MSTINYTYNVIVDRFRQFSDGHFQLRRFTHGEISQADLEKEAEWPWMHVKPRAINYSPGTRAFSFEIFISDLPRDKEDKTGYQAESITDCSLIFQDLINEIHLGQMFGDDVLLTRPVNSEPFVEQYTHTLTGVTGIIELSMDYDWSACSIPASWNYNTPTNSNSSGFGSLQFIESLEQNGVFVSLDNDLEAPGNSYYYGTNGAGVKGWYASQAGTVTSVGLTAGTGISVSGGPITSSGSITVTNSAPDQVVALTAGTGITTSGTYPNFTITNSAPSSGGTVTSVAALTLGTTGTDLSSTVATSTTTPVITLNVPTASAANRGALSSADWTTFNSKLSGLTVGTTPIASGTVGRVLFEGTGNVLQEDSGLSWDNTNKRLNLVSSGDNLLNLTPQASGNAIVFNNNSYIKWGSVGYMRGFSTATTFAVYNAAFTNIFNIGTTAACYVNTGSNFLIGTTTDAGYKLDVNGTARIQNHLFISSGFAVASLGNNVNLRSDLIGGSGYVVNAQSYNTLNSSGNEQGFGLFTGTYAPTSVSGTPSFNALKLTPTINQTGGANGITRGLYINPTLTAAADFRAIETTAGRVVISDTVTVTGTNATSLLDLSQTWNTTGAPIALKVNITDTASASTSDLISLQVGGSVRFRVVKSGFFSFNTGGDILGNLCVGGSTINVSCQLEVRSTTKGFLPPRMTTTQKNAIASPAAGLVVYDTTLGKLCVRGAAAWETITSI